jgi:hypothetical protein
MAFNETLHRVCGSGVVSPSFQFWHINQEAECVLPDSEAATFYGELNADSAVANLVIQPETADKAEESSCFPMFRHNVVDYHPFSG